MAYYRVHDVFTACWERPLRTKGAHTALGACTVTRYIRTASARNERGVKLTVLKLYIFTLSLPNSTTPTDDYDIHSTCIPLSETLSGCACATLQGDTSAQWRYAFFLDAARSP